MGLLKKKKNKKSLAKSMDRISARRSTGDVSTERPSMVEKVPPCSTACPSGNDVRGWLTIIGQRKQLGLSLEEAMEKAWAIEVETNPFPATMGRICPHPCEGECNRVEKDGAVAINSVEREIGDWAIEHSLPLTQANNGGPYEEKVAVVGAGPSGLSCAYQLARKGYSVKVYESLEKPGGMLRYGIPKYRLPREVLDEEIKKIEDLGVEILCGQTIGSDLNLKELQDQYDAIFVGIGAHKGKTMGIPGEEGTGVYTGTEFLNKINSGEEVEIGKRVVVIGGGDTAIDAARVSLRLSADAAGTSRRMGAEVTILYRRTRKEMPAIEREIDEALEEGINIEFLAAPIRVVRSDEGKIDHLVVQRMELGEPDDSGRRRPVPIEGDVYELKTDSLVLAVSQQPDWSTLGGVVEEGSWLETDSWGRTSVDGVWSGGDALRLGLATISIGQGRKSAESIHASLRGLDLEEEAEKKPVRADKIQLDYYSDQKRAEREVLSPEERLQNPDREMDLGIGREEALEEVNRCFSCGKCFGCENCWMYCQNGCFTKVDEVSPGVYMELNTALCDGCKKCAEQCPCGYLSMG